MSIQRTILLWSLFSATALCLCLSVVTAQPTAHMSPSGPSAKSKQADGVILSYEEIPGMQSVEISHSDLSTYSTTPSQSIAGRELIVNGNIQPLTCTWTELDSAELRVVFDLGEEYRLGKILGTTASVTLDIVGYTGLPGATGAIVMVTRCTLSAGELAPEQLFRANIKNSYTSIGHFAAFVAGYNGTTVATVQSALRVVLSCVVQWKVGGRNIILDNPYPGSAPTYLQTISPGGSASAVTQNPVTFQWDGYACTPNFPLYQLQILRLYNISTTSTLETDIVAEVDWNKALTVETSSTTLTLTLAEGRGYYIWRVRPIGNYYEGGITNPWNWGQWTATPALDPNDGMLHLTTAAVNPPCVFFYNQFDDDKNWIFSRTFTEHAKMSEMMTYANGLQMSEQVQRRMQSQATKVVQQTLYDYAGRSALSSLPVPFTETVGSTSNAIRYVGRVNLMSYNGARYTAEHFDSESGSTVYQPNPVNGGAFHTYYSASGSSTIPNAEGYPYSRTLYYGDGGSRTKEKAEAGGTHRVGAGHTSRTFYAAVFDQELVRIFGDEAPDAASVAKVVQYDPNTTGTVQYISKEGKIIATALVAGSADEPLETLDEEEIFAASGGEITDYILQYPAKTNNVQIGKTLRAGKTIVLTEPVNVYLDYELTPRAFLEDCMNACVDCDYRVYFTIFSTDDNSVRFIDSMIISPGAMQFNPASCEDGARQIRNGMTVYLEPGSYRVERRIESDNPVAAEKLSYLAWHKQTIAQEIRDRFDALNGGNGLDYVLATYLSDTATAPLSEMYSYLYAHFGGLTMSIGCGSINIPYRACPKTKCEEGNLDFEQYLKDKLGTPNDLGDHFGSHKAYPGLEDWAWGSLNTVIQNMLADGYNCDDLWQCWEAAVELKSSMSDPAVSSAYSSSDQPFHLLDAFLDCTGRKFAGVSGNPDDFLKKPYKHFNNSGIDEARYNSCRDYVSFWYGLNDSADWETVYKCWMGTQDPPDKPTDKTIAINELRDSCLSTCEYRRAGFRRAVVRTYLDFDPQIDTTTIPVDCIVDSLIANCQDACNDLLQPPPIPEWVYQRIANFMSAGFDLEIPSPVVPACAQGYELIGQRNVTPGMLWPQINAINAVLLHYQEQIMLNGPTPELMAALDSILLVMIYDLIKESPNCVNGVVVAPAHYLYKQRLIDQIMTLWQQGMLLSSRVQLYLDGCRLEMRTGTYIQAGCIYEMDQDTVIYPPPLDTAIVNDPCLVKVPPMTDVIVLCEDMCVWSTGCSICLHWIEPEEITTSIVGNKHEFVPKTCKDDFAPEIRASIQKQLQALIEGRLDALTKEYSEQCMAPEHMDEVFKVRYKMRMHHYTLYYYDRAGNLVRTVPPAGVKYVNSRAEQPAHTYVTKYKYNSLRQVVWQSTPDGGATEFIYNNKGQLRLSRNAEQLTVPLRYSYLKYDALGRTVEAGEVERNGYPTNLDDIGFASFPTSADGQLKDRTLIYYSTADAGITYLGDGTTGQKYLQGRPGYTVSDADGDLGTTSDQVKIYYSYDPHGGVQWLAQSIPGAAQKYLRYEYDLFSGNVVRLLYNERREDQFIYRYEYDEDNRIRQAASSRDGYIWEIDARYSYYEHGPLQRTVLGEDQVQGVDYTYTIHGWLKAINHASLAAVDDPGGDGGAGANAAVGRDAFGMILGYYQGDFNKSGSAFHSTAADKLWDNTRPQGGSLYNGNIASWETKIGSTAGNTQYAQYRTGYIYRYDRLNRIKSAKFRYENGGWQVPAGQDYSTSYTYDPNGNITTLNRYAHSGLMDELVYSYYGAGGANPTNRLARVEDNVAPGSYSMDIDDQNANNYSYDEIGNLTGDAAENLTVEWNAAGKVHQVTHTSGKVVRFLYDATGNRVRKEVTGSSTASENGTTYYISDPNGQQIVLYRWSGLTGDSVLVEYSLYGDERLGQRREDFHAVDRNVLTTNPAVQEDVHSGGMRYTRHIDRQVYELKDHLGNVRAVAGDIKEPQGGGVYMADVKSYANYYAFGMQQPERCWSTDEYRYGFNGKEKDNELKGDGNSYDFGGRLYDPRTGVWYSVDPQSAKYPEWSPYNYAFNSPNYSVDPDGESPISMFVKQVAKVGIKKAAKEFIENQLKKRLGNYASRQWGKQFLKDAEAALDILDSEWWEYLIEVIPVAGDAYGAAKLGEKGYRLWKHLERIENRVNAVTSTLKNTSALRKALRITDKAFQAHHIIPVELLEKNQVVQDAVAAGFKFNDEANGIAVKALSRGGTHANHPSYTANVRRKIEQWAAQNPDYTPEEAKKFIEGLAKQLKQKIQKESVNGNKKVNDLKF